MTSGFNLPFGTHTYLYTAVGVQCDAALALFAVFTDVVVQRAGLEGEPALRPVPPQLTFLPQVTLVHTRTHTLTETHML